MPLVGSSAFVTRQDGAPVLNQLKMNTSGVYTTFAILVMRNHILMSGDLFHSSGALMHGVGAGGISARMSKGQFNRLVLHNIMIVGTENKAQHHETWMTWTAHLDAPLLNDWDTEDEVANGSPAEYANDDNLDHDLISVATEVDLSRVVQVAAC